MTSEAAIRALHTGWARGSLHSTCRECYHDWPCPTIQALDEDDP